jgi:GMP synthase-like glutamine amidotransferase
MKFHVATTYEKFEMFPGKQDYTISDKIDYVVFTGGADVNPDMYGQKKHKKTFIDNYRDKQDDTVFKKLRKTTLKVGICRGAQYLTVKSGGTLIQNVDNHLNCIDEITTNDGVFKISSDHHQMMNPFEVSDHVIIAKSNLNRSTFYEDGDGNSVNMPLEPEIVYYPNTHSLCIQGHPEWDFADDVKIRQYVNNLILHYCDKFK